MVAMALAACAIGRSEPPLRTIATVRTESETVSKRREITTEKPVTRTDKPQEVIVTETKDPITKPPATTKAPEPESPKVTTVHTHTFGNWVIIKQPTTSEEGLMMRTCRGCGAVEYKTIDKLSGGGTSGGSSGGNSGGSSSDGSGSSGDYYDMQREVLEIVNKRRSENGLPSLSYSTEAQSAADLRAKEISTYFSHTRPDGRSCFTVFNDLGIPLFMAAENIAYGYRTPEEVMKGWMNSEGHRENILRSTVKGLAVGIYPYGNGTYYWVQVFTG